MKSSTRCVCAEPFRTNCRMIITEEKISTANVRRKYWFRRRNCMTLFKREPCVRQMNLRLRPQSNNFVNGSSYSGGLREDGVKTPIAQGIIRDNLPDHML